MNKLMFFVSILSLFFFSACDSGDSNSNTQEATTENNSPEQNSSVSSQAEKPPVSEAGNQNTGSTDQSSIESDIQFIRDKYEIITNATQYKTVPFETQCDEMHSVMLERKYNEKGALSYLKYVDCGGHGCSTRHHYFWEGQLIFIFYIEDFTPGSSHIIEEYRTYFKDGQMIRCLEKKAHSAPGKPSIEETLKKATNKEVGCTPDKVTKNLSELMALDIDKAKNYFCSSLSQ